MASKAITFKIGTERFSMDLFHIKEIKPFSELKNTQVPNSKAWLKGLINLRGSLVPVIDLGIIFNIKDRADQERNVIILSIKGRIIGILVDSIGTIMDIKHDELKGPPATLAKEDTRFISGVKRLDNALILHITPETLLSMNENGSNHERRKHTRKTINLLASYAVTYNEDLQWQPCIVVDISAGGAKLQANEHLNIGTTLKIMIKDDIQFEGMVINSQKSKDRSGEYVGIKFNEHHDEIDSMINKLTNRDN